MRASVRVELREVVFGPELIAPGLLRCASALSSWTRRGFLRHARRIESVHNLNTAP